VRAEASAAPLPALLRPASSTHAFGVHAALELARALGRLPQRVVVLGVVGARFDAGAALSTAVRSAISPLADAALRELCAPEPGGGLGGCAPEPAAAVAAARASGRGCGRELLRGG
jgi:hypothetical protein